MLRQSALNKERVNMNSRGKQIIKVGIAVLIVVLLGMMLTHCANTTDTKSAKSDKTVEKSKKKLNAKKPGKNKATDVDKASGQEEKKEETAKTDSSNKSNTSVSKKDSPASTTNTGSNKNNTSSSSKPSNSSSNNSGIPKPSNNSNSNSESSKPAEHTHNWVAQYKTVNVPEQGHNEQVLVQAAYDEQVPVTEMKAYSICSTCGADITGNTSAHVKNHVMIGDDKGGYYTEWRETVVGYNTVHHDAVYETRYVVDSPATTKQELTGYKCSDCGKTRSN